MIGIEHIRAFATVADTCNFRLAAERLKISQPTLTARIKQFEEASGIAFFDRTSRSVILTSAGEEFLPMAIQVISDFEFYLSGISDYTKRKRGHVRIAALYSVATILLPGLVTSFCAEHPQIKIELRDDNSAEVVRRVLKGEVDLGFGDRDTEQPDLNFEPLFRDSMVVAFKKDSPLSDLGQIRFSDLREFTYIGFGSATGPGRFISRQADIPSNVRFPNVVVWNTPTLEALLMEGTGVSIVPSLAVTNWHRLGLESRPLGEENVSREVFIISRRGRTISPVAKLFRSAVIQRTRNFAEKTGTIEFVGGR